jgi:hypothetical protein
MACEWPSLTHPVLAYFGVSPCPMIGDAVPGPPAFCAFRQWHGSRPTENPEYAVSHGRTWFGRIGATAMRSRRFPQGESCKTNPISGRRAVPNKAKSGMDGISGEWSTLRVGQLCHTAERAKQSQS